jgi:hypothetical protein
MKLKLISKNIWAFNALLLVNICDIHAVDKIENSGSEQRKLATQQPVVSSSSDEIDSFASSDAYSKKEKQFVTLLSEANSSHYETFKEKFKELFIVLGKFQKLYQEKSKQYPIESPEHLHNFTMLYNVSGKSFVCIMNAMQKFNSIHSDFAAFMYPYFLEITERDFFFSDNVERLSPTLLVELNFDTSLTYYNFLCHLTSLLGSYSNNLAGDKDLMKRIERYSEKWFTGSKNKFPLVQDYKKIIDNQLGQLKRQASTVSSTRVQSKNQRLVVQKSALSKAEETFVVIKSSQAAVGMYDAKVVFHDIVNKKNLVTAEWLRHKDIDKLLEGHNICYQKLMDLEKNIAQQVDITKSSDEWTFDDFQKVYHQLKKDLTSNKLNSRLPELLVFSVNCGLPKLTELRLKVFAQELGGSTEEFESVPGTLKSQFVVFKYLQGEPKYWDMLGEEEDRIAAEKARAKQQKNQAKDKKKRQLIAQAVHFDREAKQRDLDKQKEELALALTKKSGTDMKRSETSTFSPSFHSHSHTEETQAEIKLRAQALLDKEAEKQGKKEAKNHIVNDDDDNNFPSSSSTSSTSSANETMERPNVTTTTIKFYQSLYCDAPKLTSEEAISLLQGFGLTTSSAKGSHTKLTLSSGEIITDSNGKVIWRCPNLTETMTIIPKWDSKDIPAYMVRNLKYILEEKVHVSPNSFSE